MRPVRQPVGVLERAQKRWLLYDDGDRRLIIIRQSIDRVTGGLIQGNALKRDALGTSDRIRHFLVIRIDSGRQKKASGLVLAIDSHGHQRGLRKRRCAVIK